MVDDLICVHVWLFPKNGYEFENRHYVVLGGNTHVMHKNTYAFIATKLPRTPLLANCQTGFVQLGGNAEIYTIPYGASMVGSDMRPNTLSNASIRVVAPPTIALHFCFIRNGNVRIVPIVSLPL